MSRLTQRSQGALQSAQTRALRFGHTEVDGERLLLALLDQPEGSETASGRRLHEHGLTRDRFLQALTSIRGIQRVTSAMPEVDCEALEKYGHDLVADARAAKLDPVIGRVALSEDELDVRYQNPPSPAQTAA
ncbi:MAG: ATP-dependent chaperone ClpB [Nocardioides sp.]|nr:ATP-dependent chaperone ClpB [Nocardioides sp.]